MSREDLRATGYYLGGPDEGTGAWFGREADGFGFAPGQKVQRVPFLRLFDGRAPTGEALNKNVGDPHRRPGFDLTWSAPKSVSVIFAQADAERRRAILDALQAAAGAGLRYIEDEACFTRSGAQGTTVQKGTGLVGMTVPHLVSRELEPQLHVHSLVFNATRGTDGKWRTLDGSHFYSHAHTAGALFRTELASRLERLGYAIERDRFSFRVAGGKELDAACAHFSTRSGQIAGALQQNGGSGAKARDRANLVTRRAKEELSAAELAAVEEGWRVDCDRLGFRAEQARALAAHEPPRRESAAELEEAVTRATAELTAQHSAFTRRDLLKAVATEGQTRGLGAEAVRRQVAAELETARHGRSGRVVGLGTDRAGEERFTTRELHGLERDILRIARETQAETTHCVTDRAVRAALRETPTITAEQREAVLRVTQHAGQIQCLAGLAGTGKTFTLDTARRAWELDGYTVRGCAVAARAAKGLGEGAHLEESTSIRKLLYEMDRGQIRLKCKDVLIVDEAGMCGTRDLHRLVAAVREAGGRLILVGDERQLQSIDAGGGFAGLCKRLGCSELKTITRQKSAHDRAAVHALAEGRARDALANYARRHRLILKDGRAATMNAAVDQWFRDRAEPRQKLILAGTNHQVGRLNDLVQARRRDAGELAGTPIRVGDAELYAGDRVLFTKNAPRLGNICNGDLGTVLGIDHRRRRTLLIQHDNGRRVTVPLAGYDGLRRGYACTTHKAQGQTVNSAYVYISGGMTDAQLGYVMASRARRVTRIYCDRDEAGPELEDLTRSLSRDRRKALAHDQVGTTRPAPKEHGR